MSTTHKAPHAAIVYAGVTWHRAAAVMGDGTHVRSYYVDASATAAGWVGRVTPGDEYRYTAAGWEWKVAHPRARVHQYSGHAPTLGEAIREATLCARDGIGA